MAYDKQIKCTRCGMSIPDVPEDADESELLCDRCAKFVEVEQLRDENLWGEYSEYPVSDWQEEVRAGDTRSGYWDWVLAQIEGLDR